MASDDAAVPHGDPDPRFEFSKVRLRGHASFCEAGKDSEDGLPKRPCRGKGTQRPARMGGGLTVQTPLLWWGQQSNLAPPRGEVGSRSKSLDGGPRPPPAHRVREVETQGARCNVEPPRAHHLLAISRLDPESILH